MAKMSGLILLIALATHEWLHPIVGLYCAMVPRQEQEGGWNEAAYWEIIYWVVADIQAVCLGYPQMS